MGIRALIFNVVVSRPFDHVQFKVHPADDTALAVAILDEGGVLRGLTAKHDEVFSASLRANNGPESLWCGVSVPIHPIDRLWGLGLSLREAVCLPENLPSASKSQHHHHSKQWYVTK